MPSSTSSSRLTLAIALLLAGCVLIAFAVEGAARVGFHRASRIQHRFTDEYTRAQAAGTGQRDAARQHVLLVGNSLLLEAVQFDRLRASLGVEWDARRLVAERTSYLDWYYGLKRLFSTGARPDVVVLMLSARQWTDQEIRGDYFAHFLMGAADLLEVARDLDLHPTRTANLAFAHASRFWGSRSELRTFALQLVLQDLDPLVELFTSIPNLQPLMAEEVEPIARVRVARLRALTDQYRAKLVLLIPPMLSLPRQAGGNGWLGLVRAAEAAGVPVVTPNTMGTFTNDQFRDAGFHLNEGGARIYTDRLAPILRDTLRQVSTKPPSGLQANHDLVAPLTGAH
jgi:hypothetical protein